MFDPGIPKKRTRILVNGGGIGGLAFAQAMRKNGNENIEVVVFEKERDESSFQQYPLHLSPSGRSALLSLLSPESFDLLVSRAGGSSRGIDNAGIHISDPQFRRLFAIERWKGEMPVFLLRWVLKKVLGEGLRVEKGRRGVEVREFVGQGGERKVRLRFDDESVEEGDFLVGAEGLSSPTLTHLLSLSLSPHSQPSSPRLRTLPYLTINFKLLSPSLLSPHLPSQSSINMILSSSVPSYSLILVRLLGTPSSTVQDLTDERAGFTYGILTLDTTEFPRWRDATDGEMKDVVLRVLRAGGDCKPEVLEAVEKEWVEGSAGVWEIVSALREDGKGTMSGWEGGEGSERVVVIGDSAHAMPPFGGVGAASALQDAVELARVICDSELGTDGGPPIGPLLASFKVEMLKRALALSQDSERRLGLSQKGTRWAVWIRWALMRLMDKSLPLALWVLSRKREATGSSG